VWRGGQQNESGLLASCYRNSLILAHEKQLSSIAFPAISCGVYGYPVPDACKIAITEVLAYSPQYKLKKVIFASFNDKVTDALNYALIEAS